SNQTTVVSGTVTVNIAPTVAGVSVTIQQGVSVIANVSGTVTAVLPGSTTGSSGVSGVLVWLGASQTVLVSTQVSGTVSLLNVVPVTTAASVSVTGLPVWLNPTQGINVSTV